MKKILIPLLLLASVVSSYAQLEGIRINGYGAYVFDNSFDTYYTSNQYMRGKIKGGFQWGAGLEFLPSEDYGIELVYYRQDTEAPISYQFDTSGDRTVDLGVNYIMLGGLRYLNTGNEVLQPYGGLLLGLAIFDNKNPEPLEESSYVKFAWGARLGVNIWATERVALKLQAQLLSAVQGFGGGLYFGTGGSGAGVSTYSTLLQFGLGGGLSIKVGQ
ncbi:MAG: porin family protein [Cyclobacteriaceae bacterium]|nr:porin family protein [Cyclobacteriaceae bacterium]MDH4298841.1 porin family protein [Cyclobacteriaceae bacterium]MDH5248348.1 porin family protein [Cyclobacteriaceae bacterium]